MWNRRRRQNVNQTKETQAEMPTGGIRVRPEEELSGPNVWILKSVSYSEAINAFSTLMG